MSKKTNFIILIIATLSLPFVANASTSSYPDPSVVSEKLFSQLTMTGSGSKNVLQSFAIDENKGAIYSTLQTNGHDILVNKHDLTGKSLANITLKDWGHGNVLSLERLSNGSVKLWTDCKHTPTGTLGQSMCRFSFENPKDVQVFNFTPAGYRDPMAAIDNDNHLLVVRYKSSTSAKNLINVYGLNDALTNKTPKVLSSFTFQNEQTTSYFQGLAVRDGVVFVYTGFANIKDTKLLYGYDFKGNILFKKTITAGSSTAAKEGKEGHHEPEGIYIYKNPKTGEKGVVLGIVTGDAYNAKTNPNGRIKRLYSYGLTNLPLTSPSLVKTTASYNAAILDWYTNTNATSYEVYRNGVKVYQGQTSMFVDKNLKFGTSYTYQVYAVNKGFTSSPLKLSVKTLSEKQYLIDTIDSTYKGSSIIDYLNSAKRDSSFAARKSLASKLGIGGYNGSASQNLSMLKILRSDGK